MKKERSITFIPPIEVAEEARRGLLLRKQFGRGGTMVGVARARDLKNRRAVSERTIVRMFSYFSRHMVDKQGKNFYNEEKPSNGAIAWLLWGGDYGASWCHAIYLELKRKKE